MNDTKGYFDRIEHIVSVPELMYFCVAWFEEEKQHKIKTGYGVSKPVYGNKDVSIASIWQGNSLGPTLWALTSSIIIKMCKSQGYGMTVSTAISKQEFSLLVFVFVDNADLITGADDVHSSGTTLIARFKALMTCWNGGIRATGGLITPEKTQWFPIDFLWDGLDWIYHTKATMPGNITLPDKNGVLYTII